MGRPLAQLLAGLIGLWQGRDRAQQLLDAADGFEAFGASVLEAWARAGAALALVRGGGQAAATLETRRAAAVARRAVTPGPEDLRDNVIDVLWPRCPPPGVTKTSNSTIPVTPDTTTTTERVTIPSTTLVRLPDPGPTTTSTTTVVPPPTPGAVLTLTPAVGPPGFVTLAQGTGFPPGPVTLTWTPGLGFTPATAGPDGTFAVRVLVFPKDRLGPRAAVASAGGVTANAAFLVVTPTVQPSGSDVTQITRIRRFNQR
ncbi:MAG: hypothetical protein M3P34_09680 [Actinomycetota bacterium]|nr:hypothetical protein [Actinomycetota bacterium]